VRAGKVTMFTRHEMLDIIVIDGRARGIVTRDLVTAGSSRSWPMPSFSPPAGTAMSSTSRRTRRAAT
jgi:hypothetical protein